MTSNLLRLADDLELDRGAYELRRAGKALRLSRIPMELLLLLVERGGDLVTREEIVARLWGKDVFLDTDNSINAAIRKLRQVLDDDPEQPRFIHTVTGRGYRFVAPVSEVKPSAQQLVTYPEPRAVNLPVSRTGFVGREKEIAAARELLLRSEVRLLTVTGPGGIGKTRLAVEVAGALSQQFSGGVHFVPLSALGDPGLIAAVIVQTLGIRGAAGRSPIELLRERLLNSSGGPMLLVLDNFEHLMQAASIVAELLVIGPNLKILATSRAPLHLYGEHEFSVPPLALPDPLRVPPVQELSQYPAVALFVQRAVAAKPGFELNLENAAVVAEICARLDGLPLAIELAAARLKILSPASLLTRLASRLQLLTGGPRDLPERQQTLRAAMDWSYDLLNPAEQKLFRRLSVFVGGCNLESAEAVCDTKADLEMDLLDGMASMVDKSLVLHAPPANDEARFVMLETIREYALEKLEVSGEATATKRAHAAYCLVLAEESPSEQAGAQAAGQMDRFATG